MNIDADGLAFMLWVAVAGLVFIFAALVIELAEIRAMRRRERRRAMLSRYCDSIIADSWRGPQN